ncbi:hypothetical protein [Sulfurimonas sp. CS5]|uniref:hypothetical protein n=1 Tax=Sulfurimonas sp. CS5 TaxID=3391145 RepID=UPI0039E9BE56
MFDLHDVENTIFNLIQENLLYFTIIVSAIIGKIKESSKNNIFTVWVIYFIGTLFHELTHLIVSIATYGKPSWFSILPSKQKNEIGETVGYTLGYVRNNNLRFYNTFLVAMAPLLLIPLSYWIYLHFFEYFDKNIWTMISYIFIIVSLLFSSIPSSVDFKLVFNKNIIQNLAIPIIIIYLLIYFEFNIIEIWNN